MSAARPLRPLALRPLAIVFARVPRLGEVKTRLARDVGPAEALRVHRVLLERTLGIATSLPGVQTRLYIAGEDSEGECEALAARHGARLRMQRGCDLGARMRNALEDALAEGLLPVLVGSDCPVLQAHDLLAAFAELGNTDAVFSPTEDGGYALVGCSRPIPGVFEGIEWGTALVMADTRERLRASGARWTELRALWDLDDLGSYRRWREASG